MELLDFFRRKPPIRDVAAVATFVDENAAFLMQKGLYEFSRARAGHYAKVLFGEAANSRTAVEVSRWRAYPLGLVDRRGGGGGRAARAHRGRARRRFCRP